MRLEERGLIFDANGRTTDERVAAFVSLCALGSGSIICGFQLGPKKHGADSTVRLCKSRDGGATWKELPARFESTLDGVPGSLSSGEIVEVEPGKLMLIATWFDRSDRERPLFDPETEGILHSRQVKA
ncbi:MAG: sialidase family protein, partial [Gammaproteobacteria bacterium]